MCSSDLSAKDGVQPMTDQINQWALELGIPCYVVFSKCNLEHVHLAPVIDAVKKRLKLELAPMQVTLGEGLELKGLVDLLGRKVYSGTADGPKVKAGTDIPDQCLRRDGRWLRRVQPPQAGRRRRGQQGRRGNGFRD